MFSYLQLWLLELVFSVMAFLTFLVHFFLISRIEFRVFAARERLETSSSFMNDLSDGIEVL
jgi:hypothetical protein